MTPVLSFSPASRCLATRSTAAAGDRRPVPAPPVAGTGRHPLHSLTVPFSTPGAVCVPAHPKAVPPRPGWVGLFSEGGVRPPASAPLGALPGDSCLVAAAVAGDGTRVTPQVRGAGGHGVSQAPTAAGATPDTHPGAVHHSRGAPTGPALSAAAGGVVPLYSRLLCAGRGCRAWRAGGGVPACPARPSYSYPRVTQGARVVHAARPLMASRAVPLPDARQATDKTAATAGAQPSP